MIAELLASKWRTAIGAWPSPGNRDTLAPGHAYAWRFELSSCSWVSCKGGLPGAPNLPTFGRTEAACMCAAAELDRLNGSDIDRLCRVVTRKGAKRPLPWFEFAGKVDLHPADAGTWTLGRVLDRLSVELVRVEVFA